MGNLDSFLLNNNINKDNLDSVIYEAFLISIFEKLYAYLELGQNKFTLKKKLRDNSTEYSEQLVIRDLIKSVVEVTLSQNEVTYLMSLIYAYLRKNINRTKVDDRIKEELLVKQNHRCKLCNKPISLLESHLDHIIPFKYVGDELDNNYQVLCSDYNLTKSASTFYTIKSLLYKNNDIV